MIQTKKKRAGQAATVKNTHCFASTVSSGGERTINARGVRLGEMPGCCRLQLHRSHLAPTATTLSQCPVHVPLTRPCVCVVGAS